MLFLLQFGIENELLTTTFQNRMCNENSNNENEDEYTTDNINDNSLNTVRNILDLINEYGGLLLTDRCSSVMKVLSWSFWVKTILY